MRPLLLLMFTAALATAAGIPPLRPNPDQSREVIMSGGATVHFSCETASGNRRSYHGLVAGMHEFLDSWTFLAGRRSYQPGDAVSVEVLPWLLRRGYGDGAVESIFMPRARPGLLIAFDTVQAGDLLFDPRVDFRHIWDVPRAEYATEWNDRLGALFIERVDFDPPVGLPRVLAILPGGRASWRDEPVRESRRYDRDAARRAMEETWPCRPGRLRMAASSGSSLRLAAGLGETRQEAFIVARELIDSEEQLLAEARDHFTSLAIAAPACGEARLDSALVWARCSLDQLLMNARGPGIFAGYHWFTNYWGRDSFIALPGACLINGDFDRARAILTSFAEHQLLDPKSARLGRLPNIVNPGDLQYAGVDGTWWWVRAARLYLDASGDLSFLPLARRVTEQAIEGALAKAVDEEGFLCHGDGETWMDAGGEHDPQSPRGNRAIEVQVLWHDGLATAALLARQDGDHAAATRWHGEADRVREAILRCFPRADRFGLADHLDASGSRDTQIRPNQIFALTLPRSRDLVGKALAAEIVDTGARRLFLPSGVTSLDPADPAWLPRHLDWQRGHFDAAYHNGDVWLWLTGPAIEALAITGRVDESRPLLDALTADLLDRGAVGTLREIRDGQGGERDDYGGATSQAWSLAEYLRVFHDAFAGVSPRAMEHRIIWNPHLPDWLPHLELTVFAGDGSWLLAMERSAGKISARWTPLQASEEEWTLLRGDETRKLTAGGSLDWSWSE